MEQCLLGANLTRVGELLRAARGGGVAPVRLFVDVVRPALRAAFDACPSEARDGMLRRANRALPGIFSELIGDAPPGDAGAGRRAVLVGDLRGLAAIDTHVLLELLEREGWMVSTIGPERRDAGRLVAQLEPAAVVLAGDVDEGGTVRRIRQRFAGHDAAPLIVRCLMDPEDQGLPAVLVEVEDGGGAPEGVGMDSVAERLARRFSTAGMPAWGVAMRRESDEVLVVTPSGRLDAETSERLREVVESRRGSFSSLVLNLHELSGSDEPALGELLRWVADEGWPDPRVAAEG